MVLTQRLPAASSIVGLGRSDLGEGNDVAGVRDKADAGDQVDGAYVSANADFTMFDDGLAALCEDAEIVPEDLLPDFAKLIKHHSGEYVFSPSNPIDLIKRSKAKRKAFKSEAAFQYTKGCFDTLKTAKRKI